MLWSAGSLGESVDLIQRTLAERYNRASSCFDATDAQTVRPYTGLLVPIERPYVETSRFDATDARPCVPTQGYSYRSCVRVFRQLSLFSELQGYSGRASICARIVSPRSFLRRIWSCTSATKALSS